MLETSQSMIRLVALVISTALFAGLWANDQSPEDRTQAQLSPVPQIDDVTMTAEIEPAAMDHFSAIRAAISQDIERDPVPIQADWSCTVNFPGGAKTYTLIQESLSLSDAQIEAHIGQLPLGMASGSYRIVDARGNVGWLRITGGSEEGLSSELYTTTGVQQQLRLIRVEQVAVKALGPAPAEPTTWW